MHPILPLCPACFSAVRARGQLASRTTPQPSLACGSAIPIKSQRAACAIAVHCISHRSALHRSSHRTTFPQAGHSPLPVTPLPGHGFRPRVWPGSLCPPPDCPIQTTRGRGAQHRTPRPLEPGSPARAPRKTGSQSGMLYFPVDPQRSGATLYSYRRST